MTEQGIRFQDTVIQHAPSVRAWVRGNPTGWRRFAVNVPDLAEQLADIFAFVAECEDWERKVDAFRYVR